MQRPFPKGLPRRFRLLTCGTSERTCHTNLRSKVQSCTHADARSAATARQVEIAHVNATCPEETTMAKKAKNRIISTAIGIGVTSLVSAAVVEQLRRPTDERTWHGKILGFPYDFRPPTPEKLRHSLWNKD